MKITLRMVALFALLMMVFVPFSSVQAQGSDPQGGKVVVGSNFTLKSGDELTGGLVVLGGNVVIENDATITGGIVVFGGTVTSNGEVDGDVVVIGGQVTLEDKSHVSGDVVTIGGQLKRADGAKIDGQIVNNVPSPDIKAPSGRVPPVLPNVSVPNVANVGFNPFWEFGKAFGAAIVVAFLGVLVALFFQDRLGRVSQAVVAQPLMVGGIGLLSVFAAIALILTVIPVIALAFAWLFGMIAIGQEIGERFSKSLRQDWTPVLATGVGTFLLVFLVNSIQAVGHVAWFVGCVTWVIPVLIGLLAVGGVVITRFGARPVQTPVVTAYNPPTGSGEVPPAS